MAGFGGAAYGRRSPFKRTRGGEDEGRWASFDHAWPVWIASRGRGRVVGDTWPLGRWQVAQGGEGEVSRVGKARWPCG